MKSVWPRNSKRDFEQLSVQPNLHGYCKNKKAEEKTYWLLELLCWKRIKVKFVYGSKCNNHYFLRLFNLIVEHFWYNTKIRTL